MLKVGDAVTYVDPKGRPQAAVLTAIWGKTDDEANMPCVNLAFVSHDESRTDSYGRQIERETSVIHRTRATVHGRYWKRLDDQEVIPVAPAQS